MERMLKMLKNTRDTLCCFSKKCIILLYDILCFQKCNLKVKAAAVKWQLPLVLARKFCFEHSHFLSTGTEILFPDT